jgi:hypothetical protein
LSVIPAYIAAEVSFFLNIFVVKPKSIMCKNVAY